MSVLLTVFVCGVLLVFWWRRGLDFTPLKVIWYVVGSFALFVCSFALLIEHFHLAGNLVMVTTLAYTFGIPMWWLIHPRRKGAA